MKRMMPEIIDSSRFSIDNQDSRGTPPLFHFSWTPTFLWNILLPFYFFKNCACTTNPKQVLKFIVTHNLKIEKIFTDEMLGIQTSFIDLIDCLLNIFLKCLLVCWCSRDFWSKSLTNKHTSVVSSIKLWGRWLKQKEFLMLINR